MEISSRKQNVYMADLIIFRFQWYQPVGCLEGREIRKGTRNSTLRLLFLVLVILPTTHLARWILFKTHV